MRERQTAVSRAARGLLTVLLVLVIASSAVGVAPVQAKPQTAPTQTVILRSDGVATNYTIQVSGTITDGPRENTDTVRKRQVNGHLGGANNSDDGDAADVIKYTGHITKFTTGKQNPKLHATLDGTLLDASLLNGNHLRLESRSNGSTPQRPVRYTVTVNRMIASGEAVEERDSPTNETTVSGWLLPSDSDGFYYRGKIVAVETTRSARVFVNGKARSVLQVRSSTQPSTTRNQSTTATPRSSATKQQSPPKRSNGHTLVIKQMNGSVGYTITVSESLTFQQRESGDSISGRTATGQVGGFPWQETSNDRKDVIHFTGALQNFEYNDGQLRVILDGRRIDPDSLRNTPAHTPTPSNTPTQTQPPTQTPRTTSAASPSPTSTSDQSPPSVPISTHSPTDTPSTDSRSPTDSGGSGLLDQLVPLVTGLAALGAVLYLIFGER